nr:TolC family protein [Caldimonas sp.]
MSTSIRVAAALALVAATAAAGAAPLSLDDALRAAEARSQQLPARSAAARAAREMAVAAGQRPDPVLRAGVENVPISGTDKFSLTADSMTQRTIAVMQEWTRGDKLRARSLRFEREAEVAEAQRLQALTELQRETATAWLDRHYQERMRDLLAQQLDEARLQVQAAEAAYRGARGPQADVFAARSATAFVEDRLAATDRDVATAKAMLARWIGITAAAEPLGLPPSIATLRMSEEDLDTALEHHPQIAVLLKMEQAAEAEAEAARTNKLPDVSVELQYNQRGPAYANMVSFNVSLPLPWDQKQRQEREIAAKLATVEQLRGQREEETRAHVAEARAALLQWRSAMERLQRYQRELLPLASDRTSAALAAYRGGTAPLAAVLDARRAEIEARMDRLRLEMDAARRWAQLNYLVPVRRIGETTP